MWNFSQSMLQPSLRGQRLRPALVNSLGTGTKVC